MTAVNDNSKTAKPTIGIIGGSGLEKLNIFEHSREVFIQTSFGEPSSPLITGTIEGKEVAILSRHGKDHSIPPSQINNRANIAALQKYGCTHIITSTACGSLRDEIGRGDMVILDQFIDFTRHRKISFFENFEEGKLQHVSMGEPFSAELRDYIEKSAQKLNLSYHPKGTVITIEGPRFSTRAESRMFRQWGADVINMSIAPEVILANEIGIPYASVALSTDYDAWKTDEEPVSWEEVLKVFKENVAHVTNLLMDVIKSM
ncbi:MAG: S-methyl-5'-thioadenosine phosphorylase [Bacteroidales bacterium]|nr:S-methyl-5'-thioadenosine phosphorylase [Bacteroidales bacterium]